MDEGPFLLQLEPGEGARGGEKSLLHEILDRGVQAVRTIRSTIG